MKKTLRVGVSALMLATCTLSNFSLGATAIADSLDSEIWTTYNNYYVMQDPDCMTGKYVSSPTKMSVSENDPLYIEMCQGETEGTQIIITAKKDISYYNLSVSDLTLIGGDAKIPSSNIDVYKQHYVDATYGKEWSELKTLNIPMTDMWPDILIPIDSVVALNENKVQKGKNQGLSIEVETKSSDETAGVENYTPAGTYQGMVTLTIDGAIKEIPLIVKVRDIDITEHHMISTAASAGMPSANHKVYEWLMEDYHLMCQFMPGSMSSPEQCVAEVQRYWGNPSFTNYEITPYDYNKFYKYMYALAQASDPDHNYLSKAWVYLMPMDEVGNGATVGKYAENYVKQKDKLIAQLEAMFPGSDAETVAWRATLTQTIRDIPIYATQDGKTTFASDYDVGGYIERDGKLPITFCYATQNVFHGEQMLEEFSSVASGPMLTYGNFSWPHMGYTFNNYGAAIQSYGWFCSETNMAGKLFWDLDMYRHLNAGTNTYESRAYYEDACAFGQEPGDGYLLVSAKKYGEPDEWLATLRLRNFRDGSEDYDLVYELEELYQSKIAGYGLDSFDFDEAMTWLYDKGLDGNKYVPDDGSTLVEMKKIAMDLYELADSDFNFLLGGVEKVGKIATATIYADADTLTINGTPVSKVGGKYVFSWDYSENPNLTVSMKKGNTSETFSASVYDFGDLNNVTDNITQANYQQYLVSSTPGFDESKIPEGTASYENGVLKFNLTRGLEGTMIDDNGNIVRDKFGRPIVISNIDIVGYSPQFSIGAGAFGVDDLRDVYYINMKIRIKLKDVPTFNGKATDRFTLTVSALSEAELAIGGLGRANNDFVFSSEHLDPDGDGWYERTVSFLFDHITAYKVAAMGFVFSDYHGQYNNMGAYIEISNVYFSAYPFGEGGKN